MAGKNGKRTRGARENIDRDVEYDISDAVKMVKESATAKFDETVEVAMNLNVDPRHADQMVRGTVQLPNGTGKSVRIAVFAKDAKADEAREAGADLVGAEDLAEKIQTGEMDFDRCIATPDMMVVVGRLGKVLGPRGLMPNPKSGTVTDGVAKAVGEFKGGKVEFRTDRYGNVHLPIGKASFEASALVVNLSAAIEELERLKPSSAKGRYFKKVSISSTMGPGIRIDPQRISE